MKSKVYKSFPILVAFFVFVALANISFADEVLSAEVYPSPSNIEAGKSDVIVYLLGVNSQLFSHSSSKEPTVEADTGVSIKDFRILSPKRAQLTIDTATETIGAIQHNLKFYDPAGEKVVKTCVFYINILGPKTTSEITVEMNSIPEIYCGESVEQEVGSFEIEGVLAGRMTLTPPTNFKFNSALVPRIVSLSVNASVYNIEVDESGDDIEFVVENPSDESIKLFFTDLFVDTSESSESDVKGSVIFQIHSDAFTSPIEVPVGHTPGYTVSDDETFSSSENSSSNSSSSSSTSGKSSYSGTSSSSSSSSSSSAEESDGATRSGSVYHGYSSRSYRSSRYPSSGYSSSYRGNSGYRSSRGYNNYNRPNSRYNSRPRVANSKPNTPNKNNSIANAANKIQRDFKVSPGKGDNFQVLRISFCNSDFDKKTAIPLRATNSGFEASMNLEIVIQSENTLPDIIEVIISIGDKYNKNIQLKKLKKGVFRSLDMQKFTIEYDEIEKE